MRQLIEAERRVRDMVRQQVRGIAGHEQQQQVDIIAGDVAAQVYHYLRAVAHSELAILRASEKV